MIKAFDPNSERFLADLNVVRQSEAQAQEQLSTGYRVNRPSDSPGQIADILRLSSQISQADQMQQNLNNVQASVNVSESVLETAVTLLQQVNVIAANGASTTSESQRPELANQVDQILQQLVGISNTTSNGQYVFGGGDDQNPPYETNSSASTGVTQLTAQGTARLVMGPGGSTFQVSLSAQQIFDARNSDGSDADGNVFAAVNALKVALTNNDQAGINSAVNLLNTASTYLNQQLAFYGDAQNRVSAAIDLSQKYETQWKTQLSDERDADAASAALQLQTGQLDEQAALAAKSQTQQKSLFDYLR